VDIFNVTADTDTLNNAKLTTLINNFNTESSS